MTSLTAGWMAAGRAVASEFAVPGGPPGSRVVQQAIFALGWVPVRCRVVSAAVGDARDGLDAEIAVPDCEVPGHRGADVVDVYAVIARADRNVPCQQGFGRGR